jgi:hypothetical protein
MPLPVRHRDFAVHLRAIAILSDRIIAVARNRAVMDMPDSIVIMAAMRRGDALRAENHRHQYVVGARKFFRRYENLIPDQQLPSLLPHRSGPLNRSFDRRRYLQQWSVRCTPSICSIRSILRGGNFRHVT